MDALLVSVYINHIFILRIEDMRLHWRLVDLMGCYPVCQFERQSISVHVSIEWVSVFLVAVSAEEKVKREQKIIRVAFQPTSSLALHLVFMY